MLFQRDRLRIKSNEVLNYNSNYTCRLKAQIGEFVGKSNDFLQNAIVKQPDLNSSEHEYRLRKQVIFGKSIDENACNFEWPTLNDLNQMPKD